MQVTRKFLNEAIRQVLTEASIKVHARTSIVPGSYLGILDVAAEKKTINLADQLEDILKQPFGITTSGQEADPTSDRLKFIRAKRYQFVNFCAVMREGLFVTGDSEKGDFGESLAQALLPGDFINTNALIAASDLVDLWDLDSTFYSLKTSKISLGAGLSTWKFKPSGVKKFLDTLHAVSSSIGSDNLATPPRPQSPPSVGHIIVQQVIENEEDILTAEDFKEFLDRQLLLLLIQMESRSILKIERLSDIQNYMKILMECIIWCQIQ